MKIMTYSEQETIELGRRTLDEYPNHDIFCLYGNLGAGKTKFAQGIGKSLGIKNVKSPTYTLIREHKKRGQIYFYHADLYRAERESDVIGLGLEDIFAIPDKIIVIEWAEKIRNFLPKKRVDIYIKDKGGDKREFTISYLQNAIQTTDPKIVQKIRHTETCYRSQRKGGGNRR